ncbi:MAG: hypothetical protein LBD62_04805 [Candidatus Margulisbacteria bacterium]|nr:hypothetical protein [Candidatus Margulisiibacteriota bacterium]
MHGNARGVCFQFVLDFSVVRISKTAAASQMIWIPHIYAAQNNFLETLRAIAIFYFAAVHREIFSAGCWRHSLSFTILAGDVFFCFAATKQ